MSYYTGYASQRGRGLGNILGGIFRAAVPWFGKSLKNAASAAGKSILKDGYKTLNKPSGSRMNKRKSEYQLMAPRLKRKRDSYDSDSDSESDF